MAWQKEDTTFNDIREKSLQQWLDEMAEHEDVAVRGGVTLARNYVAYLEQQVEALKRENELKNEFLKKVGAEKRALESRLAQGE